MRIVVLTNGSTHGLRILEALARRHIRIAAIIAERPLAPRRPALPECLERLGYQTTAALLFREACESIWPGLPALRYRRFTAVAHRVMDHNSSTCAALLTDLRPDLIVLGGARILRGHILERARIAVLNAHPGLLPAYRGNDVIAWALHNGDPVGVTVHVVDAGIDTGAIVLRQELPVGPGESIATLRTRAEVLAAEMMARVVSEALKTGQVHTTAPSEPRGPLYRPMPLGLRAEVDRKRRG